MLWANSQKQLLDQHLYAVGHTASLLSRRLIANNDLSYLAAQAA